MKLLLMSLALAMLMFTGCSQKSPYVDMTGEDTVKTTEISADKKADDISGMDAAGATAATIDKDRAVIDKDAIANAIANAIAALEEDLNNIYFDFDKYHIRPDMESKIRANARLLNTMNAKDFSIKVEGNTDEWGSDEYNFALGLRRASAVKERLSTLGVEQNRVMIISLGESNPAVAQSNQDAWAKNRRAEFKILP